MLLLRSYLDHCEKRIAILGINFAKDAFVFSLSPDCSTYLKPDSVSQRYAKMCARLGLDMNIHQLRHYSATELISAGVDVRTVAGRLGHGGGGTTTLRVYAAWVSESDQRAASLLSGRMPHVTELPTKAAERNDQHSPYQQLAAALRNEIATGTFQAGETLPPLKELAQKYAVAEGTAHRALTLLKAEGLISAPKGKRAVVTHPAESAH
jgi:integrase